MTRLLKPAIGGNSAALWLATVTPVPSHLHDSVRSLELAVKARQCTNIPVVNQSMIADTLRQIRLDIRTARDKLQLQKPGHYMHDVDPSLLANLKRTQLLSVLSLLLIPICRPS